MAKNVLVIVCFPSGSALLECANEAQQQRTAAQPKSLLCTSEEDSERAFLN